MSLTVEQIIEEAGHWPPARVAELVDSLTLKLHQGIPADVEKAWKQEVRRRLAEIESGRSQPVDGEEVSARVRLIVGR
jgi:putative addiction module component (TIGR02574 family)